MSIISKNNLVIACRNSKCSIVAKEFGVSNSRIYQLLELYELKSPFVKNQDFNFTVFEKIDSEEKAYWLGFLYADGYVQYSPKWRLVLDLAKKDFNHIQKYRKFMKIKKKAKYRKSKETYLVSIGSKKVTQDLHNLGCFNKKSLTLKFPTEEQVPKELMRHFIRGYVDGDGWFNIDSFGLVSSGSFLREINRFLFKELGLFRIGTIKMADGKMWGKLRFSNHDIVSILDYLYKDSTIYLDRKYKNYLAIKEKKCL